MGDPDDWTRQQLGTACYLCPPQLGAKQHMRKIASLSISDLYLLPDQRFPGHSALIFTDGHATRLDSLTDHQYARFTADLRLSIRSISNALHPDHMNIALLGNSCPHLHWGIAPRYRDDPCWGRPIWTSSDDERAERTRSATESDTTEVIARILAELQYAA
jgi:diadenosine tetraphosphate (Ap4A) HIT family hydrolase